MKTFLEALRLYQADLVFSPVQMHSPDRIDEADKCIQFLLDDPNCFERSNIHRHFTGSALIVDDAARKTLLVHHKKYDKWVQSGGHCDGIKDPFFTAWQEAYQETGLRDIHPVDPWVIADINVQDVPAYRDVPEHWHHDIRYVFRASSLEPTVVSDESNDVMWVDVARLRDYTDEKALIRLAEFHFGPGAVLS
ncbi:NUDIX hydrolase [Sinorhizobium meliloti]|nr:NUDIX hydrolase [Sinorhizobium meliloti]